MNILLFSKDKFLINLLMKQFDNVDLKENNKCYMVVVFDNYNQDFIKKYIITLNLDNYLIINIAENQIDNISNLYMPFKAEDLISKIDKYITYYKENIIECSKGILNLNKKHFTNIKNNIIYFTDKEIELIKFLKDNNKVTKEDLLDNLWNVQIHDNKVVETVLYKIKRKFKTININDCILSSDGFYRINL